jgi:chitinase
MNYDYFGSWDNKVGFNAPLKNNENELSVMFAIEYFLKMGAPANKLVMGVPFYGRTFRAKNKGDIGDETIDSKGFQGPFTKEDGFMGYNEVCKNIFSTTFMINNK